MSAAAVAADENNDTTQVVTNEPVTKSHNSDNEHDGPSANGDESEEEEEPKLKYDKLTSRLTSLYRNGDSSSTFAVAGNKMIVGTHNGNVHVLALPTIQPLRTYQAHSATITSCSISPIPPPLTLLQRTDGSGTTPLSFVSRLTATEPKPKESSQPLLSNTPDNAIYIATSSLDGHVCVFNLLEPKDVLLRNFARPVNAIALSPEYKNDRMYLSGGRAGQLILTKGGKAGVSADANTNSTAAAASGWLGSIGLSSNTGKDSILHQGEGNISTIKWSRSGKWVAWVNEEGVKIMRSHLRLGTEESENAWRRINYAAKPNRRIWEEMAGVWKARAHWIDDHALEQDDADSKVPEMDGNNKDQTPKKRKKRAIEKLIVGWGDTAWILHIEEGPKHTPGLTTAQAQVGSADIIHKLQFRDCVVSGLCLYSPSLLAILAYRTRNEEKRKAIDKAGQQPRRGRHKHTGLAPQLRLINVHNGEELDVDELPMNRFETLSAQDYDFETLYIPPVLSERAARETKGALEGLWEVSGGYYAQKMLSSSASVLSRGSSGADDERKGSITGKNNAYDVTPTQARDRSTNEHQYLLEPGLKLFISSPYDCVVGVRRESTDHLGWLLQHEKYAQAWRLIDEQPSIIDASSSDKMSMASGQAPARQSLADFLGHEDADSIRSNSDQRFAVHQEKLRIGELWLSSLIAADKWLEAGRTTSTVLAGSTRWEYWILLFAHSKHFDEIAPHMPTTVAHPSIPPIAYEIILGHYITNSPSRLQELVERWEEGLFDASAVVSAIRARLASNEIHEGSTDWRALLETLGHLYLSLANPHEALKCYIYTQNAEQAFALIREERIADALSDNVTGFLTMKLDADQLKTASLAELEAGSEQAIRILVEEAHKSTVTPSTVLKQLQEKGADYRPFLYFYLRTLWQGLDHDRPQTVSRRIFNQTIDEGHAMVEDFADLAVEVFAEYDRDILMEFLEASEVYDYNRAAQILDDRKYIPELVLVLSRTGQTKRALWLIIEELGDATKAIAFVKENPDLWDDLLDYGMEKPKFVRGLLAEVGTSIDPVKVIRKIPPKLEIEGLKRGILDLVQGWEVQLEVSRGVERVLRGEVLEGMEKLRQGQRQGIHFQIVHESAEEIDVAVVSNINEQQKLRPGHCVGCKVVFTEDETQPLLGFTCGHVYHLSCLLGNGSSDQDSFNRVMASLDYDHDLDASTYVHNRSVGAKVTHAHIIRNALQGGCRQCPLA